MSRYRPAVRPLLWGAGDNPDVVDRRLEQVDPDERLYPAHQVVKRDTAWLAVVAAGLGMAFAGFHVGVGVAQREVRRVDARGDLDLARARQVRGPARVPAGRTTSPAAGRRARPPSPSRGTGRRR